MPDEKSIYTNPSFNTSFSGADIVATITPLGGKPRVFGEIQTLSYSIYRPMTPVYAVGRIGPKGIVRGQRMIAGTLIFTVFDRHVLRSVVESYNTKTDVESEYWDFLPEQIDNMRKYMKTDELPPFDINITFLNEYGNQSTMNLYGVYVHSEGQTMSIEDMITENTMQYIALDIDLMNYGDAATGTISSEGSNV